MLHPTQKAKTPYIGTLLGDATIPAIAATDYMKIYADQVREFVPGRYIALGTDGFGRSDTRARLREFFEVNRYYITIAALKALADEGNIPKKTVATAIKKYAVDPEKTGPCHRLNKHRKQRTWRKKKYYSPISAILIPSRSLIFLSSRVTR